jgi:uncharacterized protein (TIGR02147 family)
MRKSEVGVVGQERFDYYGRWYYAAIRELLFFYEFRGDYKVLARKLNPSIKPAEARNAIHLLVRLDFVRQDASGRYRPRIGTLKKDGSSKSAAAAKYLKANMQLGMDALKAHAKDERHVSAMTLSFSEPFRIKAVAEIESLRGKLLAMMEDDPEPERVFQMNLQFFPLSR